MFDYKLIEALAMVVQENGFDKAARRLFITQSAVSQRIRLLEEQTGQIVVVRSNPPKATAAGQRMIKHYQQVKWLEDDLLDTFTPQEQRQFVVLAIGINHDSLAFWFPDTVIDYLKNHRVLLDLRSDDQEQTDQLLKDGEVIGCISSKDQVIQGCRRDYLGHMDYRMVATPGYMAEWFPGEVNLKTISQAPIFIFDRKDELHLQFFKQALGDSPSDFSAHYLPSAEQFVALILAGLGCGLLPDRQSQEYLKSGELVELVPGSFIHVKLYWHCWNIKSQLLDEFTHCLVNNARELLDYT